MPMDIVQQFEEFRSRMNEKILASDNLLIKRIYHLDSLAFEKGSLDESTKELIGLTCSLVLRCDDCVRYHLVRCNDLRLPREELFEALSLATLIGGTIVIPHLRRAVEFMEELNRNASKGS
jgi:AhpD family alkylhydroperoxidase